ncbi:hypothetical protein ACLOJK_013778 [Asimina triloba]
MVYAAPLPRVLWTWSFHDSHTVKNVHPLLAVARCPPVLFFKKQEGQNNAYEPAIHPFLLGAEVGVEWCKKPRTRKDDRGDESLEMEKRLNYGSESWWRGLNPEMFALVIGRIPSDEIARTVPFVARSWRDLLSGPYCWSVIDIEQWCRRCNRTDVIDPVVRKLVRRSDGMIRCISAYKIGYSAFSFLAC